MAQKQPSSGATRRARRARQSRPSLLARLRALTGRTRIVVYGGLIALVLIIVAGTGSAAYGMQLENHDVFCASCHTEPESTYYQQSLEKSAATLAAFHTQKQVTCIDCHSGGGPFGRIEGLSQGVVDLAAFYSGNYHRPAITQNKLGDDSCLKCHGDVVARQDFNNHFHFFLARWQNIDPNAAHCVDCHVAHPAGDPTQQYISVPQVQAVCQRCHTAVGAGN